MGSDGRTAESAWTPLSHPAFRALWIASLVSNIGTWMHAYPLLPGEWLRPFSFGRA